MNNDNIDEIILKRREYHRKWRAEHPESVRAAQERYWTRKVERMRRSAITADVETRNTEEE